MVLRLVMGAWSVTVHVAMADPVTAMVIAAAAGVGNHGRPPGRATSGGARGRGRRHVVPGLRELHLRVEEELHALRLQLLREVHALALHLGGLLQLRGLHALIRLAEAPYRMRQLLEPPRAVVAAATVGAPFVRPLPLPVHRRRKRRQRREAV
uniref:Secreted protein n=1 Tax=Zea mays TaxID=4577 RepID=B8A1B0_MAIZE|nr:unknown [Zea mays]